MKQHRHRLSHLLLVLIGLISTTVLAQSPNHLIISQIYGGGGNSGATYRYDFIELYNPTSIAVDLSSYSIQYASSTGTSWSEIPLTGSVQPGHYFLLRGCVGNTSSTAPDLPVTSDFDYPNYNTSSCNGNLSGTSGKVALVSNTTSLSGTASTPTAPFAGTSCPSSNTDAIVDFVGYGAATCYKVASAPIQSATLADSRTVPPTNTDNNSTDFSSISPDPHNATYSGTGNSTSISLAASFNPASIVTGNQTTLTVTYTPTSTGNGYNLTIDLTSIGGSKLQNVLPNMTNGYTTTVTVPTMITGSFNIPVSVQDLESETGSTTAPLTVTAPAAVIPISQIQGVKSKTAEVPSPYVGQKVTTEGIVTAILPSAFFIQSLADDGNPLTPEGIEVYTKPPTGVTVGTKVQVTGTVSTFPTIANSKIPASEITSATIVNEGTATLPAPVMLTANDVSPNGTIYQLTPYEGMRVGFASLTAVSPTDGSLNETSETYSSYGEFYAVVTGVARPFRQPGIDLRDPVVDPTKQTAVFNDSPERIYVDSGYLVGSTPFDVSTGAQLPNITGVLDFTGSYDDDYIPARFFPDTTYSTSSIVAGMTPQAVAPASPGQFTVASFNIERFYNTNSADDLYYVPAGVNGYNGSSSTPIVSSGQTFQSEAVDVTPTAYANRLKKISLAVRTILNSPDIVTLEEVENQSVATDIANQINTDAGVPNLYTGYSTDNSTYYTQDGTGISVGFLVKNTVTVNGVSQYGQGDTFTPTSGSLTTLNDRPWLVLDAGIKRAGGADYPVTVIVNHMKALTGINSTTTNSTRLKKELQAEDIAKYIQTLQAAGKHVISGGDFNAYEFSDGYTDTLGTYTNVNVLPANQVVQPGVPGLVTPPLTDMALTLPQTERWSYSEFGDAQILDHMVVTSDLAANASIQYAHIDADFPVIDYNDPTTPARSSDHDPVIGYFTLPALTTSATLTPASNNFGIVNIGTSSTGFNFTLTNTGQTALNVTSVTATGDFAASSSCGSSVAVSSTCSINVVFTPTASGTRNGALTVVASGTTYTASLNGTGNILSTVPLPTVTPGLITFTSPVVIGSSLTQTATVTNTTSVTLPINITVTGDFSQTNTCGINLAVNGTCTIAVTFTPTVVGARTGTLTLATLPNAPSGFGKIVPLSGTGVNPDVNITGPGGGTMTTQTVPAGTPANVTYTFTAVDGVSTNVTLSCTGPTPAPAGVTCTVPGDFTVSGTTPVTKTITITTTARTTSSGISFGQGSLWSITTASGLAGLLMLLAARSRRMGQGLVRISGLLLLVLAFCLPAVGCGSSGTNNGGTTGSTATNPNGTPAGTYNYTVTATANGAVHSQTITLVVQ